MGWSAAVAACRSLDAFTQACLAQTGIQNEYHVGSEKYMFEHSRREHGDGAITGTIWRYIGEHVRRSGTFRIEGDGKVTRGPKFLKDAVEAKNNELFIKVEYDLDYAGGNYSNVGDFAFIPVKKYEECGSDMNKAFTEVTGYDPIHIVYYSPDEPYKASDVFNLQMFRGAVTI